jgi:hypothetical protein
MGKGEQARKMTNKSERAVSAMLEPGFNKRFPDEKAAAGRLVDIRYNGGPVCPYCGVKANIHREGKDSKFSIVPNATIHFPRSKGQFLKKPVSG